MNLRPLYRRKRGLPAAIQIGVVARLQFLRGRGQHRPAVALLIPGALSLLGAEHPLPFSALAGPVPAVVSVASDVLELPIVTSQSDGVRFGRSRRTGLSRAARCGMAAGRPVGFVVV